MDLALTVVVFTALGWLVDRWLGWFPVATIAMLIVGSVGVFMKMKMGYDARMAQLEAERRAARAGGPVHVEDAA